MVIIQAQLYFSPFYHLCGLLGGFSAGHAARRAPAARAWGEGTSAATASSYTGGGGSSCLSRADSAGAASALAAGSSGASAAWKLRRRRGYISALSPEQVH